MQSKVKVEQIGSVVVVDTGAGKGAAAFNTAEEARDFADRMRRAVQTAYIEGQSVVFLDLENNDPEAHQRAIERRDTLHHRARGFDLPHDKPVARQ